MTDWPLQCPRCYVSPMRGRRRYDATLDTWTTYCLICHRCDAEFGVADLAGMVVEPCDECGVRPRIIVMVPPLPEIRPLGEPPVTIDAATRFLLDCTHWLARGFTIAFATMPHAVTWDRV